MGVVELVALLALGAVVAVGVAVAAVARDRRRRNQVVPGTDTGAPASWAGAHTPEARLHRRLRDAVRAVRSVADPDGSLLAARVEVERAAVAVDEHLVALAALPERETAGRMPVARAAVAAIESAAAAVADAGRGGRVAIATAGPGRLPAVAEATERVRLLEEAFAELDEVDLTTPPSQPRPRVVLRGDDGEPSSGSRAATGPSDGDEPGEGSSGETEQDTIERRDDQSGGLAAPG